MSIASGPAIDLDTDSKPEDPGLSESQPQRNSERADNGSIITQIPDTASPGYPISRALSNTTIERVQDPEQAVAGSDDLSQSPSELKSSPHMDLASSIQKDMRFPLESELSRRLSDAQPISMQTGGVVDSKQLPGDSSYQISAHSREAGPSPAGVVSKTSPRSKQQSEMRQQEGAQAACHDRLATEATHQEQTSGPIATAMTRLTKSEDGIQAESPGYEEQASRDSMDFAAPSGIESRNMSHRSEVTADRPLPNIAVSTALDSEPAQVQHPVPGEPGAAQVKHWVERNAVAGGPNLVTSHRSLIPPKAAMAQPPASGRRAPEVYFQTTWLALLMSIKKRINPA